MPDKDPDEAFRDQLQTDITSGETFSSLFISCTTIKDPTSFDGRYHTLEVVTFVNHESFAQFSDNRHSQEYLAYKERLTEKLINSLEKVVPGVRNNIVQKELGTPMTNIFYINSTDGNVYGTEKSFWQIGAFSFKSKSEIENLYLCGASILSNGVAGATYSGVQTAAQILGCSQHDLLRSDASQNVRIYDSEDPSEYPQWMQQKIKVKKTRAVTSETKASNPHAE